MVMDMRTYLVIDLKSFYASVECVERKLDPFKVDLVVADIKRNKGAICLAISPSMKEKGIKNRCRIYEIPKNEKMFYEAGKKIGSFSKTLKDFNKGDIINTIDNFHNVEESYNKFIKAFNENKYFRKKFCLIECNIAIKNKFCYNIINKEYINGNIPKRLVHYDTKISNILFNDQYEAVAVIDLDTVMVGLLIYDYADAVRCGISNLKEDDRKINNMKLKYNMFEVFTLGFLESCIDIITDREINLLVSALEVITYECGIRFLTDFLNNDIYFKTNYCNHNLIRARNQLHLYLKIVESEEKLKKIVQKCLVKVIKNNELK